MRAPSSQVFICSSSPDSLLTWIYVMFSEVIDTVQSYKLENFRCLPRVKFLDHLQMALQVAYEALWRVTKLNQIWKMYFFF